LVERRTSNICAAIAAILYLGAAIISKLLGHKWSSSLRTARKKETDFSIVDPSKNTIFEQDCINILLFYFAFVLVFPFFSPLFGFIAQEVA